MNEYAWHYLNLSMDNTSRCHIYLFPPLPVFREVFEQAFLRKWANFTLIFIFTSSHYPDLSTIKSLFFSHATSMCPEMLRKARASPNHVTVLIPPRWFYPWAASGPPQSHSVACFSLKLLYLGLIKEKIWKASCAARRTVGVGQNIDMVIYRNILNGNTVSMYCYQVLIFNYIKLKREFNVGVINYRLHLMYNPDFKMHNGFLLFQWTV